MKNRIFLSLISLFLLQSGFSQTGTERITIDQAVQRGMTNSKQLKLDTVKLLQMKVKQQQVNDAVLPQVSVSGSYTRLSPIDPFLVTLPGNPEPVALFPVILNNYQTKASVYESVFNGWKLKYTQESYNFLTQASQLDIDKDQAEVRFNIISAYISFAKLKISQQIVSENLEVAKKRVEEVTAMRDRGTAIDNDVLKAQLYQSNIELSKSDIDNSIEVAQYNLCILLNYPAGTKLEADTNGMFAAINLSMESYYESKALSNRTEMKAADFRAKASESNVNAAKSVFYPSVGVGANYYLARPNQRIIPYVDEFRSTWDVGVSLSWNLTALYSGRHNVQDAQVQLASTQIQNDVLNDNIRMEVFQNYATCQNSVNKIATLKLAVAQAEENSRQVKAKYDNQTALMSDVLDADAALLQAKINLTLQLADAQVSYYRLEKSAGELK